MTKLKVEVKFIDKLNGELRNVGDIIEVEESRAKELLADARNFVTEVKEEKKAKAKKSED